MGAMMREFRKHDVIGALLCLVLSLGLHAQSQKVPASDGQSRTISDQEIELLRQDLRSQRKQIISEKMSFSEAEAQKFWPVFDRFSADLAKINDSKYGLIREYVRDYSQLTDAQAISLVERWLKADQDSITLRRKYLPEFLKVLPPKRAALYQQLERRIQLMVDMQLASDLQLIQVSR
jgi:hypothetical protein